MENAKTELLAPAGDLRTLICAVNVGADAVYVGGNMFSARAYAANFSEEDLITGIKYAHLHNVRVHLAVNTLFKNTETKLLFDYLRPLVTAGLDAVIVQDLGVMSILRREFGALEIHASTQCTVTDVNGLGFFADLGIKRVVPARELSLDEISDIVKAAKSMNMETEVFIHGALCYSYSGQCLMSSIIGGRSGNRGRCAQPCRLPYQSDGSRDGSKAVYPLSLKDYNGAYNLHKLLDIGVDSLKIEGRMKSADYVYGVVKIYRRLIDEYLSSGKTAEVEDISALDELGQRGGNTPGYPVMRNGREMVSLYDASHRSKDTGLADDEVKKIKISGYLYAECDKELTLCINCDDISVAVTGGMVSAAEKKPVDEAYIRDKISALGNTFFSFETLEIAMPDEPVFISAKELKDLRRKAIEELENRLTGADTICENTSVDSDYRNVTSDPQIQIVTESLSQVEFALEYSNADIIFVCAYAMDESDVSKALSLIKAKGIMAGIALPYVFRGKTKNINTEADCFLVRNYGGIKLLLSSGINAERIYADHCVYTWNNEAIKSLRALGIKHFTAPLELNAKELSHRDNSDSAFVTTALYPLMISAGCVRKTLSGCDHSSSESILKDRIGKDFKVKSYCNECMNVIYNSLPTDLSGQKDKTDALGFEALRIDLCGMDENTAVAALTGKITESTNGHFKRGVE